MVHATSMKQTPTGNTPSAKVVQVHQGSVKATFTATNREETTRTWKSILPSCVTTLTCQGR